jgi:hypothetical protein
MKAFRKNNISDPAFRFLPVSEPKKLIKTDKNQKTRELGDLGPIFRKIHMSPNVYYIIKSIYDQQTPVGQLNKKWWPYITKRPQGQFARTFHQSEQVGTMEYSGSFYQTNPEAS